MRGERTSRTRWRSASVTTLAGEPRIPSDARPLPPMKGQA
jgi:hypothetical protein